MTANEGGNHWLKHVLEQCVLLVIGATAVVFPLSMSEAELAGLRDALPAGVYNAVLPWVSQGYSPLVLKECVLLTLVPVMLFLFCWMKIRAQYLGEERPALERGRADGWRYLARQPVAWIVVLMMYAGATVAWSEVFQQSLRTWLLLACGATVYLVIRGGVATMRMQRQFMLMTTAVGVVMAGLALAQHLDAIGWLPSHENPRNRIGSLIGHNTGLSAWLLFPLAYCLYAMVTGRVVWLKVLAGASAALIVLVLVIAQSRSIWVITPVMIAALLYGLPRALGRAMNWRAVVVTAVGMAAVLAALTVAPSKNPLAKHLPVSLVERLKNDVLNLDQLRRETRVRIGIVSLTQLFAQAPLQGTGLGSFAWEYPAAQARYFTKHPDTRLGMTVRRTEVAHNDYLQLLTETGLIGLALLAGFGVTTIGEGRRRCRAEEDGRARARALVLAAPVAAVAVHALLDFPAHVAPIGVLAAASLALAWPVAGAASGVGHAGRSARKATLIGLGASVVIFAWYPLAWASVVGTPLKSDYYYQLGQQALMKYHGQEGAATGQADMYQLDVARRAFREAVVTDVFNGDAYEGLASAHLNRAQMGLHNYGLRLDEAGGVAEDSAQAEGMRTSIRNDAQTANATVENQLHAGGPRYHYTWYVVGAAFLVLAQVETDDAKRAQFEKEARIYLGKAYEYNPADVATVELMAEVMGADAPELKMDR